MALPAPADGQAARYFGVYPAVVTKLFDDPDGMGRVQVRFPTLGVGGDRDVRAWATLCSPYADGDQGLQIMPEKNSQVVVAFEAGDFRRPYIVGAAWNGTTPLAHKPTPDNNIRMLRTRADSRLEFDDTAGAPKVSITTRKGYKVVIDEGSQEITITHPNRCTITLTSGGSVDINGATEVNIKAPELNVTAATSNFSGIVNCTTLNASVGITSPLYSTGVGNLW
ncbi:MAG: phage baseplate assembly protein V [Micropruina sp.]